MALEVLGELWEVLVALLLIAVHWGRTVAQLNGYGDRLDSFDHNFSEKLSELRVGLATVAARQEDIAVVGTKLDDVAERLKRIERLLDGKVQI